ncbi:unnamed protein product, partial [Mesorhabditis spiculigera]
MHNHEQPSNEPRYTCLNCSGALKVEPQTPRSSRHSREIDPAILTQDTGEARNLIQIISDSEAPQSSPICQNCLNALMGGMEEQYNRLSNECNELSRLIEGLKACSGGPSGSARRRIDELRREEADLKQEIGKLAEDDRAAEAELAKAKAERDTASQRQQLQWSKFRNAHKKLLDIDEATRHSDAEKRYASEQLHRLTNRSALDLAFHIWADGSIGTINGFRLGRLPDENVDPKEINCAWGQAALLLDVLLNRMKIQPSMYKIVCVAGYSFIREVRPSGAGRELPLYISSGWRLFSGSTHGSDEGAAAFLDCLATLAAVLQSRNKLLPHTIKKDCLLYDNHQYSVKMQFNNEERWTKAMKCMLSNLKAALVHVNLCHINE